MLSNRTVTLKINPLNDLRMTQNTYFDGTLKELTEIHQERSDRIRKENSVNTFKQMLPWD